YSAIAACDAIGGQGDGGGNGCASLWNCADAPGYAAQPASAVIAGGGLSAPSRGGLQCEPPRRQGRQSGGSEATTCIRISFQNLALLASWRFTRSQYRRSIRSSSSIGRTSMLPSRVDGQRAASARASSRSRASM